MKKIVGMVLVALMSVLMMSGCATGPKDYMNQQYVKVSVSGDVPKAGTVVGVLAVIGYETKGPYKTAYIWRQFSGDGDVKMFTVTGGRAEDGIPRNGDVKGKYAVTRNPATGFGIYFNQIK